MYDSGCKYRTEAPSSPIKRANLLHKLVNINSFFIVIYFEQLEAKIKDY